MICNSARILGGILMNRSRKALIDVPFNVRLAWVTFCASENAQFSSSARRFTPLLAPIERRMTGASSMSCAIVAVIQER